MQRIRRPWKPKLHKHKKNRLVTNLSAPFSLKQINSLLSCHLISTKAVYTSEDIRILNTSSSTVSDPAKYRFLRLSVQMMPNVDTLFFRKAQQAETGYLRLPCESINQISHFQWQKISHFQSIRSSEHICRNSLWFILPLCNVCSNRKNVQDLWYLFCFKSDTATIYQRT